MLRSFSEPNRALAIALAVVGSCLTHADRAWGEGLPIVAERASEGAFSLVGCTVHYDEADAAVVKKTAALFADDLAAVTGQRPEVSSEAPTGRVILLGTLGDSGPIDRLAEAGKLDVAAIRGGWERFSIQRVDSPAPGVEQALVIVGSDRRGTAFGAFSLSESIGATAWRWWADVPAPRRESLFVVDDYTSKAPSVKYRGIFLNDEDWGLKPWAADNYEPQLGDIGPKTYARVFELVLRLKGNMVAPAMHECTGAFYTHPESKVVADEYGVIITTSHCEPLLFNNASDEEWDRENDGEWNYATNKETIYKKLDDRVREASPYENIYTMGMRGLHDEGMRGKLSPREKVATLERLMDDQRGILQKHLQRDPTDIQQIFVPYKETLGLYELGLNVPEDVTLVWVDDNYGYLKRLGDPQERARSGGAGVYYHFSYLGPPHDYLWLCTTPPVLMQTELKKAYDNGARRYWLVNVGDIKPMELGMQTFFDYAWDVERYDAAAINRHQSRYLARLFGEGLEHAFQRILDEYYRLAWSRKPEFMGWERQWDAPWRRNLADTEYSFQNYNDAQQRLADYRAIAERVREIAEGLPEEKRPAFFEVLEYPVRAAYQMNRKFLLAQLNHELAEQGDHAGANWAAAQARDAYERIESLTEEYNSLLGGKWRGMMSVPPGLVAKYHEMPKLKHTAGVGERPIDLTPDPAKNRLEGCAVIDLAGYADLVGSEEHTLRVVDGLGYDGHVLQLGEGNEPTLDPEDLAGVRVEYEFEAGDADRVKVSVSTVPFFPLHKGKSTRYGVSVDGQPVQVARNEPREFSNPWKDQVLQNGVESVSEFALEKRGGKHKLTLTCGDPGVMVQRVVIDWGGLRETYVGPAAELAKGDH